MKSFHLIATQTDRGVRKVQLILFRKPLPVAHDHAKFSKDLQSQGSKYLNNNVKEQHQNKKHTQEEVL